MSSFAGIKLLHIKHNIQKTIHTISWNGIFSSIPSLFYTEEQETIEGFFSLCFSKTNKQINKQKNLQLEQGKMLQKSGRNVPDGKILCCDQHAKEERCYANKLRRGLDEIMQARQLAAAGRTTMKTVTGLIWHDIKAQTVTILGNLFLLFRI